MQDTGENFIFVSYSHKDSDVVYPIIEALQKRNFNVWYDSGIEVGSKWTRYLAEKITDSQVVVVMLSKNAQESQYCCKEINFSVECQKDILVVYVEDFEPSIDIRFLLGDLQNIRLSNFKDNESFYDTLAGLRILQPCKSEKKLQVADIAENKSETKEVSDKESNEDNFNKLIGEFKKSGESVDAKGINSGNDIRKQQVEPLTVKDGNNIEESEKKPAELSVDTYAKNSRNTVKTQNKSSVADATQQTSAAAKTTEGTSVKKSADKSQKSYMASQTSKSFDEKTAAKLAEIEAYKAKEKARRKFLGEFDIRKVIDEYNTTAKHRICYEKQLKSRQVENALKYIACETKKTDNFVGLMDMTVLSSGKEGALFYGESLLWRYMGDECCVNLGDVIDVRKSGVCTVFYMYYGEVLGIKNNDLFDFYRFAEILLKHRDFKKPEKDLTDRPECLINKAICYANKKHSGKHFKRDDVFHFAVNLTERQRLNALEHFTKTKIKDPFYQWRVDALLDTTKNKTGKEGLLVANRKLYDTYAGGVPIDLDKIRSVTRNTDSGEITVTLEGGGTETKNYSPYSDMVYAMFTYILRKKRLICKRSPLLYEYGLDEQAEQKKIPLPDIPYVENAIVRYNKVDEKILTTDDDSFNKDMVPKTIVEDYVIDPKNIVGSFKGKSSQSYLFTKNAIYWEDSDKDESGAFMFDNIRGIRETKNSHISVVSIDGMLTGIETSPEFNVMAFVAIVCEERSKWDSAENVDPNLSKVAVALKKANMQVYKDMYIPGNVKMFRFKSNIPLSKKNVFRTVVEPDWVLDEMIAYSDTSDGKGETGCWITEKGMYCITSEDHHCVMYDRIASVKKRDNELSITYKDSTAPEIICAENAELICHFLANLFQDQTKKTT